MARKITTVIFDIDGLMIDSEYLNYLLINELGKKKGYSCTLDYFIEKYCGVARVYKVYPILGELGFGTPGLREEFSRTIWKKTGDGIKPGLVELYNYLVEHKYTLGVGTNSTADSINWVNEHAGIEMKFDVIVGGLLWANPKPAPDIYLEVARQLNKKPEECLVLEDSDLGVKAGLNAGMTTVWIKDLKDIDEEAKKRVYNPKDLTGVIDILKELNGDEA